MLHIHPNARTTPAVRAEIARSTEPSTAVARRSGISAETVRKWRKRGAADYLDRSAQTHRLPWKATEEERAVVYALRRATNFPLDDLTFIVRHFLPHLNRDSICNCNGFYARSPKLTGPEFKEADPIILPSNQTSIMALPGSIFPARLKAS